MSEAYGNRTRITTVDALVGKTIERVSIDTDGVFIAFADQTFLFAKANVDSDCDMEFDENGKLSHHDLLDYGLIDITMYHQLRDEKLAQAKAKQVAEERAEFERLKAKFEPVTEPANG